MSIYDQHDKAFRNVSAFVIAKDGKRVATVAFKFGDAVTVYVHWIGIEMVKGRAGGGGYDRKTAACADAVRKIKHDIDPSLSDEDKAAALRLRLSVKFVAALQADRGPSWENALRDAGFDVWSAV